MMKIISCFGILVLFQAVHSNQNKNKDKLIVNKEIEDLRYKVVSKDLVPASQAKPPNQNYISTGAIVCDVRVTNLQSEFLAKFGRMIDSMLAYSLGTPLHFVIITDKSSFQTVHAAVFRSIGLYITETLLLNEQKTGIFLKWKVLSIIPLMWIQFVDITSITDNYRKEIDLMKNEFSQNITEEYVSHVDVENHLTIMASPKYSKDLFYLGPFYANAFTQINRLIMFDADLIIKKDLSNLHSYFDVMNSTELIGVTTEQTGYYIPMINLLTQGLDEQFIFTDEQLKIQGTNTGVVLYQLEKMRESMEYQTAISLDNIVGIKKRLDLLANQAELSLGFVCGDQEFFTLLMWTLPHLFKIIPCSWNFQSSAYMASRDYTCKLEPFILHQHFNIDP